MAGATPISAGATTQEERTMAVLAHVLQVVGCWIAPLIVLIIKRESRFVSFHALQALFLQVLYMVLIGVFVVAWFTAIFVTVAHAPQTKGAPMGIFILMPIVWLGWIWLWAMMLVVAIVYGIKAGRGEWAEYPVLGRWARGVLKIGPGGAPIP